MIITSLVNICQHMQLQWASQVALVIKNPPADAGGRQETRVQSLVWENPLGEGLAIHSNILAWRISWTEELGGLPSIGSQRVGHDWSNSARMHSHTQAVTKFFFMGTFPIYSPSSFQLQNAVLITVTILYIINVSVISLLLRRSEKLVLDENTLLFTTETMHAGCNLPYLIAKSCSEACSANWNYKVHLSRQCVITQFKLCPGYQNYHCLLLKKALWEWEWPQVLGLQLLLIFLIPVVLDKLREPFTLPSTKTEVIIMNVKVW